LVACIVAGLSTAILFICPADAQLDRLRKLNKEAESAKPAEAPMAKIPEGPFGMGIDGLQGLEDERPFHQVRLDAYAVDLHEVTTGRYAAFLRATNRQTPWQWESVNLEIHGDRPVIGVDWHDAEAYCRWAGKRLPTEAE